MVLGRRGGRGVREVLCGRRGFGSEARFCCCSANACWLLLSQNLIFLLISAGEAGEGRQGEGGWQRGEGSRGREGEGREMVSEALPHTCQHVPYLTSPGLSIPSCCSVEEHTRTPLRATHAAGDHHHPPPHIPLAHTLQRQQHPRVASSAMRHSHPHITTCKIMVSTYVCEQRRPRRHQWGRWQGPQTWGVRRPTKSHQPCAHPHK